MVCHLWVFFQKKILSLCFDSYVCTLQNQWVREILNFMNFTLALIPSQLPRIAFVGSYAHKFRAGINLKGYLV